MTHFVCFIVKMDHKFVYLLPWHTLEGGKIGETQWGNVETFTSPSNVISITCE